MTFIFLPVMTSTIFHTRRPNNQENVRYVLDVYVSADFHYSNFVELKERFTHRSISLHVLCTIHFQVFGGK